MTWRNVASVIAGMMTCACVIPYIRDVRSGKTRPQRMSWLVFASISAAATVAQVDAGGLTSGAVLTGGASLGFGAVAVLSIKYGVGGLSRLDLTSVVGLVLVLIVWSQTDNETVAVALIIGIEIPAVAVTAQKAWRHPDSETRSSWLIDGAAGIGAVIAAQRMSFPLIAYPVYHSLSNISVVLAIAVGTRRTGRPLPRPPAACVKLPAASSRH